jgi:ParB-like chromosome segregation protein Spo0J
MEQKLKIEYVPIDSIKEYKRNAKLHPDEQVEQICNSIRETGFNDPIGVWHGECVEGHGRILAAKKLGMKEVPIIRLDELTDEQRRAYALAHNKLTMNSGFDIELLDMELAEIETIDMTLLGFDDDKQEGDEDQPAEPSRETSFNYKEQYGVIVMCKDEQEQEAVYNRLAEEGYECKVVAV